MPAVDSAIPAFGYNHVSIDRGFGPIRNWTTTHAAAHRRARLEDAPDRQTRRATFWRIRPTGRRRTKQCSRGAGCVAHPSQEAARAG